LFQAYILLVVVCVVRTTSRWSAVGSPGFMPTELSATLWQPGYAWTVSAWQ